MVTGQDAVIGPWICKIAGGEWCPGRGVTIGLMDDTGDLIAGVLYEDYNQANITMHIAAVPGRRWLCREFLWFCFYYPFEQLGCKRVTGLVAASNLEARRFDEHLGFQLEATLEDAHPDGDLLVYKMRKEDCRWLQLKRKVSNG